LLISNNFWSRTRTAPRLLDKRTGYTAKVVTIMGGATLVTPKIMMLTIDQTRTETLWMKVLRALKKLLAMLFRNDKSTDTIARINAMKKPMDELRRVLFIALIYNPEGWEKANFRVEGIDGKSPLKRCDMTIHTRKIPVSRTIHPVRDKKSNPELFPVFFPNNHLSMRFSRLP